MGSQKHRPRGYIEQLHTGSYRAIVPIQTDPLTGQRRRLRRTCKTLADAKVALTELQRQVDRNEHPKSAITVSEAIDQWMEVVVLGVTTRERYEDLIRLYIQPRMGTIQASRLDAELLERLYARLQRCRDLCSARPPKGRSAARSAPAHGSSISNHPDPAELRAVVAHARGSSTAPNPATRQLDQPTPDAAPGP